MELHRLVVVLLLTLSIPQVHARSVVEERLGYYADAGAGAANPAKGAQLWRKDNAGRTCTRCHADNPAEKGRHVNTGKEIQPMAPSVNPKRFTRVKTIEKWFLRNCKWTYGRVCTAQEKSDLLAWLASQ